MAKFATQQIPARAAERAATRWDLSDSCMISKYAPGSHGYAQIGWYDGERHRMTTAHRAAWVHHSGRQVPDGHTVDHRCKNRRCVNPNHLRVLINLENARRTNGWDWTLGTCRHGHGVQWWRPKGPTRQKGYCHACRMERQQRKRATVEGKNYRD